MSRTHKSKLTPTARVQQIYDKIAKEADITEEIQSEIDPSINFRRCSINILVGGRGSGKTFNVLRELMKLRYVKDHHYTKLLYVTDKAEDPTFTRIKDIFPLTVEFVPYADAVERINELAQTKSDIKEMKDAGVAPSMLSEEAQSEIGEIVGETVNDVHCIYHTAVLLDDAINILNTRLKSHRPLLNLLFRNRQPAISYFITVQDLGGTETSVRENADAIWIFGCFSKRKFRAMLKTIPHAEDDETIELEYSRLKRNQAIIFENSIDGYNIKYITN